jgi:hypothetical protein
MLKVISLFSQCLQRVTEMQAAAAPTDEAMPITVANHKGAPIIKHVPTNTMVRNQRGSGLSSQRERGASGMAGLFRA